FLRYDWERHRVPIRGAVHVDMGCGNQNPLGRMFCHLMLGAQQGICIDLDVAQDPQRAVKHLARLAAAAVVDPGRVFPGLPISSAEILSNIGDFDLAKLARGDAAGLSPRLIYLQRSIAETGLDSGTVDVVFSHSVLEHLPDLQATLEEWRRITKV